VIHHPEKKFCFAFLCELIIVHVCLCLIFVGFCYINGFAGAVYRYIVDILVITYAWREAGYGQTALFNRGPLLRTVNKRLLLQTSHTDGK